jgi:hypothetical protein
MKINEKIKLLRELIGGSSTVNQDKNSMKIINKDLEMEIIIIEKNNEDFESKIDYLLEKGLDFMKNNKDVFSNMNLYEIKVNIGNKEETLKNKNLGNLLKKFLLVTEDMSSSSMSKDHGELKINNKSIGKISFNSKVLDLDDNVIIPKKIIEDGKFNRINQKPLEQYKINQKPLEIIIGPKVNILETPSVTNYINRKQEKLNEEAITAYLKEEKVKKQSNIEITKDGEIIYKEIIKINPSILENLKERLEELKIEEKEEDKELVEELNGKEDKKIERIIKKIEKDLNEENDPQIERDF